MNTTTASQEAEQFTALVKSLVNHSSREAARRGRYAEAERILVPCVGETGDAVDHVLLGKIYAQQGKYAPAIEQWELALARDPDSLEAHAAIVKARELLRSPPAARRLGVGWVLPGALLLLLLVCAIALVTIRGRFALATQERADLEMRLSLLDERLESQRQASTESRENLQTTLQSVLALLEKQAGGVEPGREGPRDGGIDFYTVREGDELRALALRFYGDAGRWEEIYEANKDVIGDPDRIVPGLRLRISP
jgi:nucleoid-associated protein YgaU